jgi:hypothetical protein
MNIIEKSHYFTNEVNIIEVTHKYGSAIYFKTTKSNKFSVVTFNAIIKLYVNYKTPDINDLDTFIEKVKKVISIFETDNSLQQHTYIMFLQDLHNPIYLPIYDLLTDNIQ